MSGWRNHIAIKFQGQKRDHVGSEPEEIVDKCHLCICQYHIYQPPPFTPTGVIPEDYNSLTALADSCLVWSVVSSDKYWVTEYVVSVVIGFFT